MSRWHRLWARIEEWGGRLVASRVHRSSWLLPGGGADPHPQLDPGLVGGRRPSPAVAHRVPPGQVLTDKWPVLTCGATPRLRPETWTFRCFGLVEAERVWTWAEFAELPRVEVVCDVHCVTRWSRLDNRFSGVLAREILTRARLGAAATHVLVHADPNYTTDLPLEELLSDDVLLATHHDGQPLTPEHGGPVRLVVPRRYFWKSAKWVRGFEILAGRAPGFWERRGYHSRGDPWGEERYAAQETRAMQQMRAAAARQRRI